jgi:hypothetical protein
VSDSKELWELGQVKGRQDERERLLEWLKDRWYIDPHELRFVINDEPVPAWATVGKVSYTTLDGIESKAYLDSMEALTGTDKYTDEPVTLERRYVEVKG